MNGGEMERVADRPESASVAGKHLPESCANGARRLGAVPCPEAGVEFCVWAPRCRQVALEIVDPERTILPLRRMEGGYFVGTAQGGAGLRYHYLLDGTRRRPDPAARALPDGVNGPSEVVDTSAFPWTGTSWRGMPL